METVLTENWCEICDKGLGTTDGSHSGISLCTRCFNKLKKGVWVQL